MKDAYLTKQITDANRYANDIQRKANAEEFFRTYHSTIDANIILKSSQEMYCSYINIPIQYKDSLYEIADIFCNQGYDVFTDCVTIRACDCIDEKVYRLYISWEEAEEGKKGKLIAPRRKRDYKPPIQINEER